MGNKRLVPGFLWNPQNGSKTLFKEEDPYIAAIGNGWFDSPKAYRESLKKPEEEVREKLDDAIVKNRLKAKKHKSKKRK